LIREDHTDDQQITDTIHRKILMIS
jgi:hypothetical protein